MTTRPLQTMGLVVAALVLTGCDEWGDWGQFDRYKEEFRFTKTLRSGGRLSLENMNGSVEITTHAGNSVEITGTKYASTSELLNALEIDVLESADSVRVRTVPPSGHRGGMGARYVIRVPARVELDRISTTNGKISVDGTEGLARLRTTNGAVRVSGVKGSIDIETSNGAIELAENDGPVSVRTTNGQVRADAVRGTFAATTTNASVTARLTDPESGRPVNVNTTNGSISLTLDSFRGNPISATTTNSSITLRLPGNAGARLSAATTNSSVATDFEVNVRGTVSKNKIEGDFNGGGAPITLATTNGAVRLERL